MTRPRRFYSKGTAATEPVTRTGGIGLVPVPGTHRPGKEGGAFLASAFLATGFLVDGLFTGGGSGSSTGVVNAGGTARSRRNGAQTQTRSRRLQG